MPEHQRHGLPLILGKRQDPRGEVATGVAIEPKEVRRPEGADDRRQLRGRLLTERFDLLDKQPRSLLGRPGLGRSPPLGEHQRARERDLKLDLRATQRRTGRQGGNLIDGADVLLGRLGERRALHGALSRFAPQACGFFDQACLG